MHLSGGLGNQMFQYAAGCGIAKKLKKELVLDTWSGFVRDREYRRVYELKAFPVKSREAILWELLPLLFERGNQRCWRNAGRLPTHGLRKTQRWYGTFFHDDNRAFYPQVFEPSPSNAWFIGYFQSFKYFEFISGELRQELMPPTPSDRRVRELGNRLRSQPTVAVGIRLYEEAKDPAAHALDRREKSMGEIKGALKKLRQRYPELKVALFCTHRARCLKELSLPDNTAFVTPEEGFQDALSCLWLLTQCRHHLFNNSSFYWWGAWLSAIKHGGPKMGQEILAANSFYNADFSPVGWTIF